MGLSLGCSRIPDCAGKPYTPYTFACASTGKVALPPAYQDIGVHLRHLHHPDALIAGGGRGLGLALRLIGARMGRLVPVINRTSMVEVAWP